MRNFGGWSTGFPVPVISILFCCKGTVGSEVGDLSEHVGSSEITLT